MKNVALSLFIVLLCSSYLSFSQNSLRFYDKVFSDISIAIDSNIVYGSNFVYDATQGQNGFTEEDQLLDVYFPPLSDTLKLRPLIIWAHGGSFLNGTKNDGDIEYFCQEFAERGFVTASINYRLGYEQPIDSVRAVRTVYRALQDGRAAIRYMRSVASDYHIDTTRIYFGGTSAGAFIGLNMGFINLSEEVPTFVDTSERLAINEDPLLGLDGIEGITNTLSNSSEIHGIINYCGATKELSWMDDKYSSEIPIISMHGTRDSTVPYGNKFINLNDLAPIPPEPIVPIVEVNGSYDIHRHSNERGYTHKFYTWYGADHVPYIDHTTSDSAAMYMDTLMQFTVKYVYEDFLGLGEVAGISENDPPCDFNNGDEVPCDQTGVDENNNLRASVFEAFPNPASKELRFSTTGISVSPELTIMDISGSVVFQKKLSSNPVSLNVGDWSRGIYFAKLTATGTRSNIIKIVLH